jgi:hypothetical protein
MDGDASPPDFWDSVDDLERLEASDCDSFCQGVFALQKERG